MHIRKRQRQSGFTLVELAVVLLIIGLIVGGILRGQDLITSAQLNSVQTDANQIRTATNTFQDKFQALPGDLSDVSLIDTSGVSSSLNDGNGNGRIDGDRLGGNDVEASEFWAHLGASGQLGVDADDIIGSSLSSDNAFQGSVGGFFTIGQGLPNGNFQSDVSNRDLWLVLGTGNGATDGNNDGTVVGGGEAAQLDRKIDDDDPLSGDLRGDDNTCTDSNGDYDTEGDGCALGLRL